MIVSVWKEDDIYRLYECLDCMDWIEKNPSAHRETYENENLYPGWICDMEPLPDFLSK